MTARPLAIASVTAAWILASSPACFDPDLSSEIPCSAEDPPCPGSLECEDGFCRTQSTGGPDAADKPDAADRDPDAAPGPDADSPPPIDASVLRCDPLTHDGCGEPTPRCAFIATTSEGPYDGYFGCVNPVGTQGVGERCTYRGEVDGGAYDDCARGLLCDAQLECRELCDRNAPITCDDDTVFCEDPEDVVLPDVSPYGICALTDVIDGGVDPSP